MKVCKFGGTSVATAKQIKKVAAILQADPSRKIAVVSAPGKRHSDDTKVTDLLIILAERTLMGQDAEEQLQSVLTRYRDIAADLALGNDVLSLIEEDLRSRLDGDMEDPVLFMDTLKASGEDNNAKLIAAYLQSIGTEAVYISPLEAGLLVNERPKRVQALPEGEALLARLADQPGIVVFPGFFGFTQDGTLRTFNRGGSDITGSLLAAAIGADLYENFTDVDSVFVANPAVIDKPCGIHTLTYREMRELSYAGFSVFHDEALRPAFLKSIPVCIKNTNNPEAPGTMIVKERDCGTRPVVGIAADDGFTTLFVDKYLMNIEIGFGRRLLQILEDEEIPFEHTPSGIDNMSVIIRESFLTPEAEARILERVMEELEADDAYFRKGYSMVVLVGERMRDTVGLTARAADAIRKAGVSIQMINQGSTEVSLVFGVHKQDETGVLRALYEEFFASEAVHT
ncbi:aspartate kinase [Sporosarcina koreensis]|uniref:aspartate kinase n=1 Tax=Sporosarcina koreensis TaxID=334735 RepID=UPI00058CB927|nr:aspartate kinase [Sporosarcina koreensis]